jgi:hypothetical protein
MRLAGAVLACLALLAVPAAAQREPPPAADVSTDAAETTLEHLLQQIGLLGTWAADCAQAASPANPRVSITVPSEGLVIEEHNIGPGFAANRYSVLSAQRLPGDRVALQVIFQPGTQIEERQNLVLLVHGGTRRTLFNQPEGGPVRVKDGIAAGRGTKTPTLKKCG